VSTRGQSESRALAANDAELDIEAEDSGRDGWFMAMTAQGVEKGRTRGQGEPKEVWRRHAWTAGWKRLAWR